MIEAIKMLVELENLVMIDADALEETIPVEMAVIGGRNHRCFKRTNRAIEPNKLLHNLYYDRPKTGSFDGVNSS